MSELALLALFKGVGAAAFCLNIPENQVERNLLDLERHDFFEFLKDLIHQAISKNGIEKTAHKFKMSKEVLVNLDRLKTGINPTFIYHSSPAAKKVNPININSTLEDQPIKRVKVDHSVYPTIHQDGIRSKAVELEKQLKATSTVISPAPESDELTLPPKRRGKGSAPLEIFRPPPKILPFEHYKKLSKSNKTVVDLEPEVEITSMPASSTLLKAFKQLHKI